jgi:amino acid adenylation domain-containing protein
MVGHGPSGSSGTELSEAPRLDFDEDLPTAFERSAGAFPMNLAVSSDRWEASYRDFNATANRLAHHLVAKGGTVGDRVAILMEHDTPAIAAAVAIVKAGRVVVALSSADPDPRLRMLIADAEPYLIVADAENKVRACEIAGAGCEVLCFETPSHAGSVENVSINVEANQTVALIYTSGSTGRPKGVMFTHRQLLRTGSVLSEATQLSADDRIPLFAEMGTGQGVQGVWYALLAGATIYPFPIRMRGITGLADWVRDNRITVFISSASFFRTFVAALGPNSRFPSVRLARLASEPASSDDFKAFLRTFPSASGFVHTLSSSEAGTIAWSRWHRMDDVPDGRLPVGHIARDMEVSLVGDDGQPVPAGEIGEIVVKSRYIAPGYWRDDELTAERFIKGEDGSGFQTVRTGDLARLNGSKQLEYCGRKDDRIKIRGNRIELADIESVFMQLPGVERAAAVAVPRNGQEPLLVVFVVLSRDAAWSETQLRQAVAANLPLHMLPSRLVFVDALPFGPGGKIDRNALRMRPLTRRDNETEVVPQTRTETLLADIWAEVLENPSQVGCNDDFYSLGGDSLKGAILAAQIDASFGVKINLIEIAKYPTVAGLAALIDRREKAGGSGLPKIDPVDRSGPLPLSIFQERIWKRLQAGTLEPWVRFYAIDGRLDVDILKDCLRFLVDRHDVLRTTFSVVHGNAAQFISPTGVLHFSAIDVSVAKAPEERVDLFVAEEVSKPIDPGRLPIARHFLFKMGRDRHWLFMIPHPLIHDGWSLNILFNELAALYEAKLRGMPSPLPREAPLRYADYAVWHRQHMRSDGAAYSEMLEWWRRAYTKPMRPVKLPFRRSRRLTGVDYRLGAIHWKLDDNAAQRLDQFARETGATHFIIRLALFVALVADASGRSEIVLGTSFSNRKRIREQCLVGPLTNLAPMIFSYKAWQPFRNWVATVRDRLYEAEAHAEIPYEELYEALWDTGLRPALALLTFSMWADLAEQRFGGLTLKRFGYPNGEMPWGCQFFVDERSPENCRVDFNANLYDRRGMQMFVDRYVRLLEIGSQRPDLTIGRLVAMSSNNRIRSALANCATRFYRRCAPA